MTSMTSEKIRSVEQQAIDGIKEEAQKQNQGKIGDWLAAARVCMASRGYKRPCNTDCFVCAVFRHWHGVRRHHLDGLRPDAEVDELIAANRDEDAVGGSNG